MTALPKNEGKVNKRAPAEHLAQKPIANPGVSAWSRNAERVVEYRKKRGTRFPGPPKMRSAFFGSKQCVPRFFGSQKCVPRFLVQKITFRISESYSDGRLLQLASMLSVFS